MDLRRHRTGPGRAGIGNRLCALALTACAVGLFFGAAGCGGGGGAAPASATGIEGTVRDAAASRGVIGAFVTVGAASTETDVDGRFRLLGLPVGAQAITVQATGYAEYNDTVTVTAGITTIPDILLVDSPPPPPQ
ncbi:MAG: carboxypeptidase regulatory-like domain-containing protein [Armatimonadota bacterium]|nr:MAG: carboxypeptidase regulatory-like domain-containing protein [Armatimonadota bacterium]